MLAQSPDGPAEWLTAAGTLAVAVAAVGVAWWSDRRTGRQIAEERQFGRAQLEEERKLSREREQLAEAYRVQVILAEKVTGPPQDPAYGQQDSSEVSLVAIVVNHGRSHDYGY